MLLQSKGCKHFHKTRHFPSNNWTEKNFPTRAGPRRRLFPPFNAYVIERGRIRQLSGRLLLLITMNTFPFSVLSYGRYRHRHHYLNLVSSAFVEMLERLDYKSLRQTDFDDFGFEKAGNFIVKFEMKVSFVFLKNGPIPGLFLFICSFHNTITNIVQIWPLMK